MNKLIKILLVTVFFSLLPVADLFALSKEATEVIEAMRMRLQQQETNVRQEPAKVVTDSNEYVPGKELAEVLARIRRNRYTHNSNINANSTESYISNISLKPIVAKEEKTSEEAEPQKPVSENIITAVDEEEATTTDQKEALQIVEPVKTEPAQEITNPDELIIIEAMEADDSEAYSIPIDNTNNSKTVEPAPVSKKKNDGYVPGQLLEQSVKRIRHSRRRNTPASYEIDSAIENYEKRLAEKNDKNSQEVIEKASEEIEELFNNPEKRAQIAEEGRDRYNSQKMNQTISDDTDDDQIDDEKFNDYISKYDFKMPENYRIIVE